MLSRAGSKLKNVRLFTAYKQSLSRRPVSTQVCTGIVLVAIGDAAAQHLVERTPRHDYIRTARMILLRGVVHSTMIIYWYRALAKYLPLHNASMYKRLTI